jgi:Flp pilus assembly protein TadD
MRARFFLPLALAAALFTAQPIFAQNVNELIRQGNAASVARNFSAAEQIFRSIISIEPNSPNAYVNLGLVLQQFSFE